MINDLYLKYLKLAGVMICVRNDTYSSTEFLKI